VPVVGFSERERNLNRADPDERQGRHKVLHLVCERQSNHLAWGNPLSAQNPGKRPNKRVEPLERHRPTA
jgi:hypothetical protein